MALPSGLAGALRAPGVGCPLPEKPDAELGIRSWIWLTCNGEDLRDCCFTNIKGRMRVVYFASGCVVIACVRARAVGELLGKRANGARVPWIEKCNGH